MRYQPPPYEPPRRTNYTPWLLGCGSCLLIAVIFIGWMVYSVKSAIDEFKPDVREAGMLSGEQLAWRELPFHPNNMIIVSTYMRSIDANGDGQRELLFWSSSGDEDMQIVNLDGSVLERHHWMKGLANEQVEFWDYDGDGQEELLYDDESGTPRTYVCDLNLLEVHRFEDLTLPDWRATADCDGDGDLELLLHSPDYGHAALFDQSGTLLTEADNLDGDADGVFQQDCLLVDMDGDGISSVLFGDGYTKQILNADGKRSSLELPQDALMTMGPQFEMAADIGGDGPTELIPGFGDYFYDNADKRVRELRNPLEGNMFSDMWSYRIPLAVFDLDGDGESALWTCPGAEMGTQLVAFGPLGNVVYHESLAKYCAGIEVIEQDGVQHIVVCAFDKVLVYP